jgi:predicted DsbA family dithiol-disulfide isomerase
MIMVETIVFEFAAPLCVTGYAALLATFIWAMRQRRAQRWLRKQGAVSVLVAGTALCYLFFFGSIPNITVLKAEELAGVDGMNVLGKRSGTLPIVEFADFECPPCAVQDQVMDKIWATYADSIRYSFRHLPKRRHPNAVPAALASQCAAEQGRFWETKRLFFASQNRLGQILATSDLPTIPPAEAQSYAQCLQSRSAWTHVREDLQWANNLGLRATPSIIVGNKLMQGVVSYPRLAVIVRRELRDRNMTPVQAGSLPSHGCGAPASQSCSE